MTFNEAYEEMKKGKKICRDGWDGYWMMINNKVCIFCKDNNVLYNYSNDLTLTLNNVVANDWKVTHLKLDSENIFNVKE